MSSSEDPNELLKAWHKWWLDTDMPTDVPSELVLRTAIHLEIVDVEARSAAQTSP